MAGALKKAVRNFLIITVAAIALAVLLSRSERAREVLSPPGAELPPGVTFGDRASSVDVDSNAGGPGE
jgi:hypothetical protein